MQQFSPEQSGCDEIPFGLRREKAGGGGLHRKGSDK